MVDLLTDKQVELVQQVSAIVGLAVYLRGGRLHPPLVWGLEPQMQQSLENFNGRVVALAWLKAHDKSIKDLRRVSEACESAPGFVAANRVKQALVVNERIHKDLKEQLA